VTSKYWNKPQVKEFAKQIKTSEIGKAWHVLVPALRHAVVEAKILAIVRMQDRDSLPMEAIMDLTNMLHAEMGTEL
jgi:hypothetical protein